MKRISILARGCFNTDKAKTAHGLIRHCKRFKIIEVVDEALAGRDAGEVMGIGNIGIPVVSDFSKSTDAVVIGIAPPGGKLPKQLRLDIKKAIKNRIDIISGMHEFLSDNPEFSKLAKKYHVKIWDVRKPPENLDIARGLRRKAPVVLVCGTDSCIGKRTTALELVGSAKKHNVNAGFVATGQTGIMVGCDAGIAVDAIPSDFVAGTVEKMIQKVSSDKSKQIIFVEGQGSLNHSAYGAVALGILYGAKPDCTIIVHSHARSYRNSYPEKIPQLTEEIALVEKLGKTKIVGISLNCKNIKNRERLIRRYNQKYKIPTADVLREKDGADKLLAAVLKELKIR